MGTRPLAMCCAATRLPRSLGSRISDTPGSLSAAFTRSSTTWRPQAGRASARMQRCGRACASCTCMRAHACACRAAGGGGSAAQALPRHSTQPPAAAAAPAHLCACADGFCVAEQPGVHHQDQVAPVALLQLVGNSSAHQRARQQLNHQRKVAALVAPEGMAGAWVAGRGAGRAEACMQACALPPPTHQRNSARALPAARVPALTGQTRGSRRRPALQPGRSSACLGRRAPRRPGWAAPRSAPRAAQTRHTPPWPCP